MRRDVPHHPRRHRPGPHRRPRHLRVRGIRPLRRADRPPHQAYYCTPRGHISREAIERAGEPKELFVIDGATHVDLYDRDEHVTPAVARLAGFFGEHLAA
ncbi:hypothetical protein [Nonomuraea rubra]|uniref:hypothetical protein n=1 Tax=Nonomuraea rubra TaxID=46180 RepID=UPI003407BF4E